MLSQGDVNFQKISRKRANELHSSSSKRVSGGILKRGESTVHSHRLAVLEDAELFDLGEDGRLHMVVVVGERGCEVVHEEHGTIRLEPGQVYEITDDREYSDEGERPVAD